jgi:hypothetical protein
MRWPGSALDNAVIEAWHSNLEFELRRREHFATRARDSRYYTRWLGQISNYLPS